MGRINFPSALGCFFINEMGAKTERSLVGNLLLLSDEKGMSASTTPITMIPMDQA